MVFTDDSEFVKFYCEVSAKTNTNVDAMFEIFVKELIHRRSTVPETKQQRVRFVVDMLICIEK